ncbi:MAG: hypothetical protein VXZ82_23105 [Planctomycetota bacterium]|nr:hypothetical protein [Planctomycetota bacterium]
MNKFVRKLGEKFGTPGQKNEAQDLGEQKSQDPAIGGGLETAEQMMLMSASTFGCDDAVEDHQPGCNFDWYDGGKFGGTLGEKDCDLLGEKHSKKEDADDGCDSHKGKKLDKKPEYQSGIYEPIAKDHVKSPVKEDYGVEESYKEHDAKTFVSKKDHKPEPEYKAPEPENKAPEPPNHEPGYEEPPVEHPPEPKYEAPESEYDDDDDDDDDRGKKKRRLKGGDEDVHDDDDDARGKKRRGWKEEGDDDDDYDDVRHSKKGHQGRFLGGFFKKFFRKDH